MKLLSRFMAWLREKNGKNRFEGDMDEELRFHLESIVEENIRAGMSPEEARRKAQINFGGIDQIKEDCRDTRWTRWLDRLWQDLRYVARALARRPAFPLIVIASLALAIAASVTVFSFIDTSKLPKTSFI